MSEKEYYQYKKIKYTLIAEAHKKELENLKNLLTNQKVCVIIKT